MEWFEGDFMAFPNIQQFTQGTGGKKVSVFHQMSPVVIYFGVLCYSNCKRVLNKKRF